MEGDLHVQQALQVMRRSCVSQGGLPSSDHGSYKLQINSVSETVLRFLGHRHRIDNGMSPAHPAGHAGAVRLLVKLGTDLLSASKAVDYGLEVKVSARKRHGFELPLQ